MIDDINDVLKDYKFYPVLKLTIGFNAFFVLIENSGFGRCKYIFPT